MNKDSFVERQKLLYKQFKPCFCPVIQRYIYFNAKGLHHLFYKNLRPRGIKQVHYRANLIKYINPVIKNSKIFRYDKTEKIEFLILEHVICNKYGKQLIKVILVKNGKGNFYFLSIMRQKFNNK